MVLAGELVSLQGPFLVTPRVRRGGNLLGTMGVEPGRGLRTVPSGHESSPGNLPRQAQILSLIGAALFMHSLNLRGREPGLNPFCRGRGMGTG